MKQLNLTQGQFALVDDNSFDWLNQWKWYAGWNKCTQSFYAQRGIRRNGKTLIIRMARVIMGLQPSNKYEVDHRNHNTLDNQRHNLRAVTHRGNQCNRRNTKGYCWISARSSYLVRIQSNKRKIHVGYYKTKEEAQNAYQKAKSIYHQIEQVGCRD
jgi:hypothetical protein